MDLNKQLASVERTVKKETLPDGTANGRALIISQPFDHDPLDLWDACTTAERIGSWFSPVSGDLKLHGRFQIQGNASGTIVGCSPSSEYRLTWEFGGSTSWVTVRIDGRASDSEATAGQEKRSRLELTHLAPVNDHWEKYGAGAGGVGWEMSFAGLAAHLAGVKIDAEQWFAAEETKQFLSRSSEAWGKAAVDGGEDPAAAKAAVDKTTSFYVPSTDSS